MNQFFSRVAARQETRSSLLCIGLDPDPGRFPRQFPKTGDGVFQFNKEIIDATKDLACCYKPQIAHYAAMGAESALEDTIGYIKALDIPVLLDAKRGDVGSTAEKYALELFERYGADAVTVNPYLGYDAMAPYLDYADRGVFILCRTSNPGGADLQHLELANGETLYRHVARRASEDWNLHGNVGLVVGATRPEELAEIREVAPQLPVLLPGIGAQGGDLEATLKAGQGGLMLLSSSRAILYASADDDFAAAAAQVAQTTCDDANRIQALLTHNAPA